MKFIVKMLNEAVNGKLIDGRFPQNFRLTIKNTVFVVPDEYDDEKIKAVARDLIAKRFIDNREMHGRLFYVQLRHGKGFDMMLEIGRLDSSWQL